MFQYSWMEEKACLSTPGGFRGHVSVSLGGEGMSQYSWMEERACLSTPG